MKIKHGFALMLVASFISMALAYGYARDNSEETRPQPAATASASDSALIAAARPQMRSFTQNVPWIGAVESRASVELTTPVAGRVAQIAAADQDRIEKGRLVIRIGGARIEGERAKVAADIQSLESRLRLARQTVVRLERSLKTQLATRDQVAQARETQISLENRLRKARLSSRRWTNQVRILAPTSGTFTNRRVGPGQDVTAGQVLGDIIDTRRLRIAASIFPPSGIALEGKQATIELDASHVLTGAVSRVLPQASSSGAVRIWIQGPQIDSQLLPGRTVEGTLAVKTVADSLAVSQSAIVYDAQEQPYLFVRKDGAYAAQRIQLGLMQDGWVQVLAGLQRNQLVVVQGAYELYYRRFSDQFKVED